MVANTKTEKKELTPEELSAQNRKNSQKQSSAARADVAKAEKKRLDDAKAKKTGGKAKDEKVESLLVSGSDVEGEKETSESVRDSISGTEETA